MQNLAISQITTSPLTLIDDLQLCQRLGCPLEIAEKKLSTDRSQAQDQLAMIQESGVRITSIQPLNLTIFPSASAPDPVDAEQRLALLMKSVELFAPFFPGLALITNTGADHGNEAKVWDDCTHHYQTLAAHAAELGMRIALEALGPSLMNQNSILFTYGQAQEMAAAVDHPSFGVCLDIYNSWQDANLAESITSNPQPFIVQIADWRRPKSLHDRLALGDGRIALADILQAIAKTGYSDDVVLEIFSEGVADSLWHDKDTVTAAVERSQNYYQGLRAKL